MCIKINLRGQFVNSKPNDLNTAAAYRTHFSPFFFLVLGTSCSLCTISLPFLHFPL
ncbi:hypothetical protein LguiA_005139 [Lonicera macranthoides]